jgi:hypothetical protein
LAEAFPINTGLDFTNEELKKFPSETLPLFSEYAYNWLNPQQFVSWVTKILTLRTKYASLVVDPTPASFRILEDANESILGFARVSEKPARHLAVIGNTDFMTNEATATKIVTRKKSVRDLLTGRSHPVQDGHVRIALQPGQCVVFEY